jgi:RNA polymerase sigma factor (TIGR02999 family)
MNDNRARLTRLLDDMGPEDPRNATELLPLVYQELRRFAAAKLSRELPGQTLQATALVHEAWLRLHSSGNQSWQNRAHFFSAAAEAMRRILVEAARRKHQLKRGGQWRRVEWDSVDLPAMSQDERVLAVDEALDELAQVSPVEAEVVKLRFFAGLEHAEIATVLKLSERTVHRYWSFAKVWLLAWLKQEAERARQTP